jgi:hypothetical protein
MSTIAPNPTMSFAQRKKFLENREKSQIKSYDRYKDNMKKSKEERELVRKYRMEWAQKRL